MSKIVLLFLFLNLKLIPSLSILDLTFEKIGSYTNEQKHIKEYFYQDIKASWQKAQDVCVEAMMEPLNLSTKLENQFFSVAVRNSKHNTNGHSFHIGGKKQESIWIWIEENNKSTKINFTMKWTSHTDNHDKKCLSVNKSKDIGLVRFEAVNCVNQTLGFFCQKIVEHSWTAKFWDSSISKIKKFFSGFTESLKFHSVTKSKN